MNGNTQGFVLNQQNPTGMALATLPAINFGANPVSFHVDKPWVIPDPGAMPSSALKGAVGDVINKALAGYQKRQAEKKKEDSDSTKDWMEWQKFEETQQHNIALENAAMNRAKATLPKGGVGPGAEGDLILKDILRSGEARSGDGQTVQDDTTSVEQPSGWLGDPNNPDDADDGETVLKMGAAPAPQGDAAQSSKLVRDSRYTRDAKVNPGMAVRGTSAKTDAQLKQLSDLPFGDYGADSVGLIPGLDSQAGFNASLANIGGIPPRVEAVIPRPGQMAAQAPPQAAAPITEAIKGAAQEPLPMDGAPMPGASAIVGQAPAMASSSSPFTGKQLPVFVSAANAPAALAFIKAYNANPSDPNMVARGLAPMNKAGDVQIQWENIGEKNKALKVQEEDKKYKSKLVADEKAARIAFREGNAINAAMPVKNYEAASGLRLGLTKFMPGYINSALHPEAAGPSDIDLMDTYSRSMTGNGITEGQAHLIQSSRSLKDKLAVLGMKPLGGDVLSQNQRDQMMRTMLEANNAVAGKANAVLNWSREKMSKEGVKDESYLPQPYVDNLILKKDAIVEKNRLASTAKALTLNEYKRALASNDQKSIARIQAKIKKLNEEAKHLAERLSDEENSGYPILGYEDFNSKRQGFVAGSGGYQYNSGAATFEGNSPVNIPENNQ